MQRADQDRHEKKELSRETHIHGDAGAVISTAKAEVTITHHCPGIQACPHRAGRAPQSLYDEHEFFRLSGIRAETREQALLEEFRQRHQLRWRGSRSIARMWRHRTLEYDSAQDALRLNPSLFALVAGWAYFSLSTIVVLALSLAPAFAKKTPDDVWDWLVIIAAFLLALFGMWLTIEHMVLPEQLARRLQKKEKESAVIDAPSDE